MKTIIQSRINELSKQKESFELVLKSYEDNFKAIAYSSMIKTQIKDLNEEIRIIDRVLNEMRNLQQFCNVENCTSDAKSIFNDIFGNKE